jgi:hypothetical protein
VLRDGADVAVRLGAEGAAGDVAAVDVGLEMLGAQVSVSRYNMEE